MCLGLARRAIDEFKQIALSKQDLFGTRLSDKVQAHVGLARAEALVRSARTYWYSEVECRLECRGRRLFALAGGPSRSAHRVA